MDQIINFVAEAVYWLADARDTVQDWVWPFHYLATPLDYLALQVAFIGFRLVDFNAWLDNAAAWIGRILSYDNIASYFRGVFDAANAAWQWVWDAVRNVWAIVDDWWSGTWADVQAWVNSAIDIGGDVIGSIYGWINDIKGIIYDLIGKLPSINEVISWFTNWWGNILKKIQDLGFLPATVITELINSELLSWLPFYDTLSEWWDSVVDFITDPLDWLMARVEYWFFDRPS